MDTVLLLIGAGSALFLYIIILFILKLKRGRCTSKADLTGKTAIVTGANTGIGYYTALDLATRNAKVILACRSREKAKAAVLRIMNETGNTRVRGMELDVSSMKSVRKFAARVLREEEHLDILVNNAGVTGLPLQRTEEGLETMFATNHFGPFLLTNLLLHLLKRSAESRIVNVSSIAHKWAGSLDLENLNAEKSFSTGMIYFRSKLGNILFTRELSRQLEGTRVTVNCLHPGTIRTELLRSLPFPLRWIFNIIGYLFFKSPEEGAQTSIYCAVSHEMSGVSGQYLSECRIQKPSRLACDDELGKRFWTASEKITGLSEYSFDKHSNGHS